MPAPVVKYKTTDTSFKGSRSMDAAMPNTIRVRLTKRADTGLGFTVKENTENDGPAVIVSDLIPGGVAEESGLIQVGDTIVRINDTDFTQLTYSQGVSFLKTIPQGSSLVMLLRGPAGCSTHLETIFNEDGTPRTVRVTQPLCGVAAGDRGSPSKVQSSVPAHTPSPIMSPVLGQKRFISRHKSAPSIHFGNENSPIHRSARNNPTYPFSEHNGVGPNHGQRHKVLKDNADGSPKITLTRSETLRRSSVEDVSFSCQVNDTNRPDSPSLEIHQHKDELTIIVRGELKIQQHQNNFLEQGSTDDSDLNCKENGHATISNSIVDSQSKNRGQNTETSTSTQEHGRLSRKDRAVRRNNTSPGGLNRHSSHSGIRSPDDHVRKSSPSCDRRRRSGSSQGASRRGSSVTSQTPLLKRYIRVKNVQDSSIVFNDTLHQKSNEPTLCSQERCLGSVMMTKKASGTPRPKEDVLTQAKDFLEQFYISMKRSGTPAHQKRLNEVVASIEKRGTYELTSSELTFGAKTAWRNAPRCIGRIQWSKLQVFDARHITTARGMFEAICNHIKYGTNKGNIRSAITIFPQRTDGKHDFKVWNPQFIQYAGYKQPDGGIIGDPANAEFTEVCINLGWKPGNGMFDVLPLVLSANGQDPEMFDIPKDLVFEVMLEHPRFDWFKNLGLKWYALPAVSGMLFDCGGLEFPAAPFNGWYMGTEIGARDLCDPSRYNILERVAVLMGLDTKKSSSLWRDSALVEVNIAVLHSFQKNNATITDHHAASDSFMKHMENEVKARGGCPADWVWVVPPMSSSLTPVFHQEMVNYILKPSYEYQELAWKTHEWKKDKEKGKSNGPRKKRKFNFRELARAVKFSAKLMGKALARRVGCTILYATETGKSERYAKTLCGIFMHAFDARVVRMDEYDTTELEHEALVLIVTSTFGNGDPPENGEAFGKALYDMKEPDNKTGSASTIMRLSTPLNQSKALTNGADSLEREIGPMGNLRIKPISKRESFRRRHQQSIFMSSDDVVADPTYDKLWTPYGQLLANVRFSVFGLGSSAYPKFCAFGHYVDNILYDLGGERIHTLVEGDELCGQEESFKIWAQGVFKSACETFCVGDEVNIAEVTGALADNDTSWKAGKYRLTPTAKDKAVSLHKGLSQLHNKGVFPCKLVSCENLQSKDSGRRTLLVKMNTQVAGSDELCYQPGDHVGIFAANRDDYVDFIITRLQNAPPVDELVQIEIRKSNGNTKTWLPVDRFPPMTLRTALTYYLDITTPPTPLMLHHLANQTSDSKDKLALEKLATDSSEYEKWKSWNVPNLVEVLKEFPSVKVNPTLLLSQLPLLQQRFYSISSSTLAHPDEVHITVVVVEYRAQGGKGPLHQGVCSAWLDRLKEGDTIPCFVRAAPSFQLPENTSLPIIMVGPGTGIAPFRSFWQQRKVEIEMGHLNKQGTDGFGDMDLYFGCRNTKMDDIYRHETIPLQAGGFLSNVYTAVSRDPGRPKEYVQIMLSKNSKDVYRKIVVERGHFYVCGDVTMASEVSNALRHIIQSEGNMTSDEAQQFILAMRENNRFHEDIFGASLKVQENRKLQSRESFDSSAKT